MQERDETAKISVVSGFQPKADMNKWKKKKGEKLQVGVSVRVSFRNRPTSLSLVTTES